jgi:hypothetical protein
VQRADDDAGLWVDPQAADAAFLLLEEVVPLRDPPVLGRAAQAKSMPT